MKKLLLLGVLILFLFCSCNQDSGITEQQYYAMYGHLSEMWAQSLEHADAENAFFGDSRVAGADWYAAFPEAKVINLGVGGDRVNNLLTRFGQIEALVKSGSLKRVFVAIGGNDCLDTKFDPDTFRNEYDGLLTKLGNLEITVYVNTVAGVCRQSSVLSDSRIKKTNAHMAQANTIILELAKKHGMDVIDMADKMNNDDGSLKAEYCVEDGVHFSQTGNACWFETLSELVK